LQSTKKLNKKLDSHKLSMQELKKAKADRIGPKTAVAEND
jgi:hypothetical protein